MSHLHEREEKVCLNCNAAIYGRFCHVCGQENTDPKESFWHLTSHFIADLFHYDGKFLRTIKYLLFKPGYLAKEHLRGRRADYLHPIRLYIFVSAFFFLIVFGFYTKHEDYEPQKNYTEIISSLKEDREEIAKKLIEADTSKFSKIFTIQRSEQIKQIDSAICILNKDTAAKDKAMLYANYGKDWEKEQWEKSRTKQVYLDSQNKLPIDKRDGFFAKKKALLNIAIAEKAKQQHTTVENVWLDTLLHNLPKGLFIGLPVYALILFIIYLRNKKYTYVSHLIFSIHLFCFTFLLILASMWFDSLSLAMHIQFNDIIGWAALLIAMLYTYKGLRNFYQQRRAKTIAKFLILSFACILVAILVGLAAFSISALTA